MITIIFHIIIIRRMPTWQWSPLVNITAMRGKELRSTLRSAFMFIDRSKAPYLLIKLSGFGTVILHHVLLERLSKIRDHHVTTVTLGRQIEIVPICAREACYYYCESGKLCLRVSLFSPNSVSTTQLNYFLCYN